MRVRFHKTMKQDFFYAFSSTKIVGMTEAFVVVLRLVNTLCLVR